MCIRDSTLADAFSYLSQYDLTYITNICFLTNHVSLLDPVSVNMIPNSQDIIKTENWLIILSDKIHIHDVLLILLFNVNINILHI